MTIAPGVDEDAVAERATSMGLISNTAEMVHVLAKAKAEAVIDHPDARAVFRVGGGVARARDAAGIVGIQVNGRRRIVVRDGRSPRGLAIGGHGHGCRQGEGFR